jgi:hypothetical protein
MAQQGRAHCQLSSNFAVGCMSVMKDQLPVVKHACSKRDAAVDYHSTLGTCRMQVLASQPGTLDTISTTPLRHQTKHYQTQPYHLKTPTTPKPL